MDSFRGELRIAEVSSRFNDVKAFQAVICSIGFDFLSKAGYT
jgi:hypothetical protein